jgi:hypothetical protein
MAKVLEKSAVVRTILARMMARQAKPVPVILTARVVVELPPRSAKIRHAEQLTESSPYYTAVSGANSCGRLY